MYRILLLEGHLKFVSPCCCGGESNGSAASSRKSSCRRACLPVAAYSAASLALTLVPGSSQVAALALTPGLYRTRARAAVVLPLPSTTGVEGMCSFYPCSCPPPFHITWSSLPHEPPWPQPGSRNRSSGTQDRWILGKPKKGARSGTRKVEV